MPRVFIGMGSNHSPGVNIKQALAALGKICTDIVCSRIYLSAGTDGAIGTYANLVFAGTTALPVDDLVIQLKAIEQACGRKPDYQTIDLDLLLYGAVILNKGPVRVPREDIERFVFVLKPLMEIAPTLIHPVSGLSVEQIWRKSAMDESSLTAVSLEALEELWLNGQY